MAALSTSAALAAQPTTLGTLDAPAGTVNSNSNSNYTATVADSSIAASVGVHVSNRGSMAMLAADSTDRVISARLSRCRIWLHPRRSIRGAPMAGCPDIYDTSIGLSSPTSMSDCLSAAESSGTTPTQPPPSQAAQLPAGSQRLPLDEQSTQILHAMHNRWQGLLAQPLGSSRSFASRRAHQARVLQSRASALCSAASVPSPSSSSPPSPSCSTPSLAPSVHAMRGRHHVNSDGSGAASTADDQLDDDVSSVGSQLSVVIEAEEGSVPLHPADGRHAGLWACTCSDCAGTREMLQLQMPLSPPLQVLSSSLPPRASSMVFVDAEYAVHGSEYAAYTESSAGRTSDVPDEPRLVYTQEDLSSFDVAASAAAISSSTASARQAGMPNAPAIAGIFSIGQPAQHARAQGVSRTKRLSRRMVGLLARVVHPRKTRARRSNTEIAAGRECSGALIDALSIETALAAAIRMLSKTRTSGRSLPFRMRADRVHMAQSQLLQCIHALFVHMVPVDARRSRHYRFYLPEDDQVELDRGFSESVLFAAQALARGYQIRGTEMHTQALREPAWMLCSVWAAVRHVLHVRGSVLWEDWVCISEAPDAMDALRDVLQDFDDAWVRFERDLCFAYFGLGNAQVAGLMDPNEGEGNVAQEEEFSLLVVLLSETLQQCLETGLVTAEQMETMDPLLILALPRLAILNAIACKGVEGLCFSEPGNPDEAASPDQEQQQQQQQPVFWWFREYTTQCHRISNALSQWPTDLVSILQTVFVAEEADVALQNAEPALEKMIRAAEPESAPEPGFVLPRKTIDLESIIDSPRSVRSMSFDCISSVCTPSSEYMDSIYKGQVGGARPHAKSVGEAPDFDECLAARLYAACSDIPVPPLPIPQMGPVGPQKQQTCQTLPNTSAAASISGELAGSLAPTAVSSHLSWPHPLSPIAATVSSPRVASKEKTGARDAERKAKLDACMAAAKQIYVDVCTVSDSLHSGPFARPFRVALEIVFRMHAEEDEESMEANAQSR